MKWFLSELECKICNEETVELHPEYVNHYMACGWCGYISINPNTMREVPESFAKSEHELAGIAWA